MSKIIKTKTGHKWKIYKNGKAKDMHPGGLTWFPKKPKTYTYDKVLKLENKSKRLPTIGELRIAWERGLSEVFKDNDCWFWSSSENNSYGAWFFYGNYGFVYYGSRDYVDYSVRCVSRSGR